MGRDTEEMLELRGMDPGAWGHLSRDLGTLLGTWQGRDEGGGRGDHEEQELGNTAMRGALGKASVMPRCQRCPLIVPSLSPGCPGGPLRRTWCWGSSWCCARMRSCSGSGSRRRAGPTPNRAATARAACASGATPSSEPTQPGHPKILPCTPESCPAPQNTAQHPKTQPSTPNSRRVPTLGRAGGSPVPFPEPQNHIWERPTPKSSQLPPCTPSPTSPHTSGTPNRCCHPPKSHPGGGPRVSPLFCHPKITWGG